MAESFDIGSTSRDEAYRRILQEVQAWAGSLKPAGTPSPAGNGNRAVPPRPAASKLATLQERLGKRLPDLEITDGMDGLIIRPHRYLGDAWSEVNAVVRSLGGKWQRGSESTDDSWRIPK